MNALAFSTLISTFVSSSKPVTVPISSPPAFHLIKKIQIHALSSSLAFIVISIDGIKEGSPEAMTPLDRPPIAINNIALKIAQTGVTLYLLLALLLAYVSLVPKSFMALPLPLPTAVESFSHGIQVFKAEISLSKPLAC